MGEAPRQGACLAPARGRKAPGRGMLRGLQQQMRRMRARSPQLAIRSPHP
ncbi:hypothetical protein X805_06600 [Sphaerotilus natans subsp. natans DSM 6575]|uniref:Uncharacterized protein n=1 Tax=Sphaerotilus natans subsp. natans DSM 6575 TaxID=1286631 RepID=A0A059KR97_9BURK|nr:hypothetical protein X805_06600 [Sphaerotilus natans subsp. natans DSM 6575]